jgi:hypothetical protein
MRIKILVALFLLGGISNLFAQNKTDKNAFFKVDSATKLIEHAGVFGGNGSIQYDLFIKLSRKKIKSIDSAWAHNQAAIVVFKAPKSDNAFVLKKNKTYHLIITVPFNPDPSPEQTIVSVSPPQPCQDLLIRVTHKNKRHFVCVKQFKLIPSINLP